MSILLLLLRSSEECQQIDILETIVGIIISLYIPLVDVNIMVNFFYIPVRDVKL